MNKNRLIYLLVTLNVALIVLMVGRELGVAPRSLVAEKAIAAPIASQKAPVAGSRRTEIVTAAETVSAAVVNVGASQTGYAISPYASFFSDYAVFPYQQRIPYLGSGVIIDRSGLVITNFHVIENSSDVFVTLMDGRELPAKVLDADRILDIALLKVEGGDLPAAQLGDSSSLQVGEWVLAMGNPFGNLMGDPHPTVTVGVVSALKRSFRPNQEMQRVYQDMIQTDAAINPGNSGGPLINTAGEVVGINTFIMSRSGGAEGIGFAIPVNRVKQIVDEILKHGKIRSRLMDFQVQNMNDRIGRLLKSKARTGAVISEMVRGGTAAKAGLEVGDVVTKVDEKAIRDADDFMINVWTKPVGSTVQLEIDRAGERREIRYQIQEAGDR